MISELSIRVGMTELMGREPSPDPSFGSGAHELFTGRGRFPVPAGGHAADHARQRADRQLTSGDQPWLQL